VHPEKIVEKDDVILLRVLVSIVTIGIDLNTLLVETIFVIDVIGVGMTIDVIFAHPVNHVSYILCILRVLLSVIINELQLGNKILKEVGFIVAFDISVSVLVSIVTFEIYGI
jgi:hypothetical protein